MSSSSLLGALARGLGFVDAPGYLALEHTPFVPPAYTIAQIHAAVPAHLRRPGSTLKSAAYAAQTACFVALFFACGAYIDGRAPALAAAMPVPVPALIVRWTLWAAYWWWQGLAFAGCFTFGAPFRLSVLSPHDRDPHDRARGRARRALAAQMGEHTLRLPIDDRAPPSLPTTLRMDALTPE
jgi:hypothetical protein